MISWRKYVEAVDEDGVYLKYPATDIRFSYLQPDEVLLARDIMNKQIVDTQGMKVVRVNDIKLSATDDNQLRLLGAEVGARGLLRRHPPAVRAREREGGADARQAARRGHHRLVLYGPARAFHSRSSSPFRTRPSPSSILPTSPTSSSSSIPVCARRCSPSSTPSRRPRPITELDDDELMTEMLEGLSDREASTMLATMDPDDAAALIEELDYEKAEKLLRLMGVKEEKAIRNLLGYEEDTAGRIMTNQFVALPATATVQDAIDALRGLDEDFESIYYVYTTDVEGALTGVLSMRSLVVAEHTDRLKDLAYRDVVWVAPDLDQELVADEMTKYDLVRDSRLR